MQDRVPGHMGGGFMLTRGQIRDYCSSKNGAWEDFPFDLNTLVFRIGQKIFALTDVDDPVVRINLKCDPELALGLREKYEQVTPGYHMNKKHWNTVLVDGAIPDSEILGLIDHSYELVFRSLKRSEQEAIEGGD